MENLNPKDAELVNPRQKKHVIKNEAMDRSWMAIYGLFIKGQSLVEID